MVIEVLNQGQALVKLRPASCIKSKKSKLKQAVDQKSNSARHGHELARGRRDFNFHRVQFNHREVQPAQKGRSVSCPFKLAPR